MNALDATAYRVVKGSVRPIAMGRATGKLRRT
jgi:hypothetical protein